MRLPLAVLVAGSLLVSVAAHAGPAQPVHAKVAAAEPLRGEKADPAVAGRALLVKELPKSLGPADRKALDAVVRELKANHLEGALSLFRTWADAGPKPLWRDDAMNTALWVFREGLLARNDEFSSAVDRVRFLDERTTAIDDAVAVVRGALLTKKPVLVAKLVVLNPYARETRGDEKRERQISYDSLDAELRTLEAKSEESKNERNSARAAIGSLEPKAAGWLQLLAALTKRATDMKLTNPKHV